MATKTYRRQLYTEMRDAYKYATRWNDKLVTTLDSSEYALLQTAITAIQNLLATIQPEAPSPGLPD